MGELTGVNPVTLRAWQRRYGLLKPERTAQGHRLYAPQDLARIRLILSWLERGVSIGKVRPLIEAGESLPPGREALEELDAVKATLDGLDRRRLERGLIEVMKHYPLPVYRQQLIAPIETYLATLPEAVAAVTQALWQGVLIERCGALLAGARERGGRPALLISFDSQCGAELWLSALELMSQGLQPTLLAPITPTLDGLKSMLAAMDAPLLVVTGERRLTPAAWTQLQRLLTAQPCELRLLGSVATIHQDELSLLAQGDIA
ncbi:hypothetical protein GCM10023333_34920 [Ferrimonas pelagia]|uniref:HTH merR-type domain-containing protein n=1 Tax=Ferrimonas pelagia TaxID=1177826 RepID=A0ABP9FEN4_9GAMM